MTKITAAEVNNLRKLTGAGMMDCKKALQESNGDMEKAIDILRKKGQKVALKRADKAASEGLVIAKTSADKKFAAIVMINCETDFVAKNEDFSKFVNQVASIAIEHAPKSMEELKKLEMNGRTVEENITEQVGKIGEKIELNGYSFVESPITFAYNHMGNKLGTVVGLSKADIGGIENIGKELAMQVAAMNPVAVDKDDVSEEIVKKEIEIGKDQARQEGKPEQMLEKIAMGKLNKFFKDNTLLNQDFVRDTKKSVRQYLAETDKELKVIGFQRIMIG
jgi:elongation factor Ts